MKILILALLFGCQATTKETRKNTIALSSDLDGDMISDEQEQRTGTDPFVANFPAEVPDSEMKGYQIEFQSVFPSVKKFIYEGGEHIPPASLRSLLVAQQNLRDKKSLNLDIDKWSPWVQQYDMSTIPSWYKANHQITNNKVQATSGREADLHIGIDNHWNNARWQNFNILLQESYYGFTPSRINDKQALQFLLNPKLQINVGNFEVKKPNISWEKWESNVLKKCYRLIISTAEAETVHYVHQDYPIVNYLRDYLKADLSNDRLSISELENSNLGRWYFINLSEDLKSSLRAGKTYGLFFFSDNNIHEWIGKYKTESATLDRNKEKSITIKKHPAAQVVIKFSVSKAVAHKFSESIALDLISRGGGGMHGVERIMNCSLTKKRAIGSQEIIPEISANELLKWFQIIVDDQKQLLSYSDFITETRLAIDGKYAEISVVLRVPHDKFSIKVLKSKEMVDIGTIKSSCPALRPARPKKHPKWKSYPVKITYETRI